MTATLPLPTAASVAEAAATIAPYVRRTPVLRAEVDGRPLVLKLEHMQRGGSFKLRGAVNALASGERPASVVTASGGNHGIAVATAAARHGMRLTVLVGASVSPAKLERLRALESDSCVVEFWIGLASGNSSGIGVAAPFDAVGAF